MKIGIVALKKLNNSKVLPMFFKASEKLGIDLVFYHPSEFIVKIKDNKCVLLDRMRKRVNVDGAINWIPYPRCEELDYAFTFNNIPYINSTKCVRLCRNKTLANLMLCGQINQPHTEYYPKMGKQANVMPIMEAPFVYKNKSGSLGKNSRKFDSEDQVSTFLRDRKYTDNIYFQKYIENFGSDFRIIVVGGKVVGGIEKTCEKGEWRTHVVYGASVKKIEVTEGLKSMALLVAKKLDAHFCGIDIIKDKNGELYFLEANSVPGMNIFYDATGINIGERILLHMIGVVKNGR